MREERDERREEADRHMPRDVAASETEDDRRHDSRKTENDCRQQRLSHAEPIMSPSPFVLEWLHRARHSLLHGSRHSPRRALDLAMGQGRHARALARAGFRTFGVDLQFEAVRRALDDAVADKVMIAGWCADLRHHPLPRSRFDVIVVTRYLQRDLFVSIGDALAPDGVLIYETFTTLQRVCGRGPTSPDHLLEPGELRHAFGMLEILFYEEVSAPDALARIVGRRAARRS